MNLALWIAAGLLAVVALTGGVSKTFVAKEKLAAITGGQWTGEYGTPDNPDDFKILRAYSPLHNVRKGVRYPPVLITTADHDDRVMPGHSLKYAATLQQAQEAASALSFIGSTVAVSGTTAQLANGQASWNYSVTQPATAQINISNSSGQLVYSATQAVQPGQQTFSWNGVDGNGTTWPSGPYTIAITATGANNQSVAVTTQVQGVVGGVDVSKTPPTLTIGGNSYPLAQIVQVISKGSGSLTGN